MASFLNFIKRLTYFYALFFLVVHCNAIAQNYPEKTIRIIVGPGSDVVMRSLAEYLSNSLGQRFYVEQLPGAGGVVAAQTVANSKPDGYTLLATTSSFAINDALRKNGSVSLIRQFEPVGLLGVGPTLAYAPSTLPASNMADLLRLAKEKPDTLNCASSGLGTPAHLGCEILRTYGKVKMEHIPYNGLAPALLDIASGRVHVIFGLESAALLKNPKIKVLSTGAKNRNPALPAVPTVAESGLAQLEQIRGWNGVHAPKGTPKAIIDKLNSEIQKAIATPEVKDRLLSAGFTPQTGSVESFSIFVREDMERWEKVVADTGAKPE